MTAPSRWLGKSVLGNEDGRFLTGRAQYMDDIMLPGMLHAAMVRSPYAHALIRRIDYSQALELPGVHGVITGQDVARMTQPEKSWTYPNGGAWHYIATDRARFAGEIVAIVAAEDRYIAEDACEAVDVEYEDLPVVNGLGWALTEKFVCDEDGQLLTGTFWTTCCRASPTFPPLDIAHIECPTRFSPLGANRMGEGGSIPRWPALPMPSRTTPSTISVVESGIRI